MSEFEFNYLTSVEGAVKWLNDHQPIKWQMWQDKYSPSIVVVAELKTKKNAKNRSKGE